MRFVKHKLRSYGASNGDISTDSLYGLSGGLSDDISHARSMSNMIKSGEGKIQKRAGYSVCPQRDQPASIGSVHVLHKYGGDVFYYLSNGNIRSVSNTFSKDNALPFDATDMKSVQLGEYMIFVGGALMITNGYTGAVYYWYQGETGGTVSPIYIPTLYIANTPSGSGHAYEGVNMLSKKVMEQYAGDGSSVRFYTHLKGDSYEVYLKNQSGEWAKSVYKSYGENYVEFETAPPPPAVTGEDNVRVMYTYDGYDKAFDEMASCNCAATFGVGGLADRVFLSGSIASPGKIFYSHMDKPLYFADIDYIKVGDCETDVFAMNRRGDTLAVIADGLIYTIAGREGQEGAVKQDALFVITDVYATPEPVGITDTCIFMDEPVYLTREGVCAVTASGILDERCADVRSGRINHLLLKENLGTLKMCTLHDMLFIYGGEHIYVLDGRQYKTRGTERLYEGFVWDGIPAKHMWEYHGRLYFTDGIRVYRFNTGENKNDYRDERAEGEFYPISAYWETETLYPSDFKDFKFFSRIGVRLDCDISTNVRVSTVFDMEKPREIIGYDGYFSRFAYSELDYGAFTYCTSITNCVKTARLLHKKGRGVSVRFENDRLCSPMKITAFGAEYIKT